MTKLGPYELNTVILGDCLEVLKGIPGNSVDSIMTDSPYGLSKEPDMVEVLTHWLNGDDYEHRGGGFMGKDWDSFVPGPAIWRECYRVMKPGGCLMAFGGTRTVDLLSIAIRLAGFQRFDELVWIHGQGFGKGKAIDKGIDEYFGKLDEREKTNYRTNGRGKWELKMNRQPGDTGIGHADGSHQHFWETAPATEAAKLWNGYKTQLKPAHEIILCFWKPREKSFAHNALVHGVAGLWIDGCRIATSEDDPNRRDNASIDNSSDNATWNLHKTQRNPTLQKGRYPSNILISHHPECVQIGIKKVKGTGRDSNKDGPGGYGGKYGGSRENNHYADPDGNETVETWECHPDCPIRALGEMSGKSKSNGGVPDSINSMFFGEHSIRGHANAGGLGDFGSASRFFYCPKAPGREKWFYCEICDDCYPYAERDDHAHGKPKGKRKHQIAHPTVKPELIVSHCFSMLEYLCRLTRTPTGGIVLDPFGGSGTTALAAIANGRDFILIENDPIYHKIATKRIAKAKENPRQLKLL